MKSTSNPIMDIIATHLRGFEVVSCDTAISKQLRDQFLQQVNPIGSDRPSTKAPIFLVGQLTRQQHFVSLIWVLPEEVTDAFGRSGVVFAHGKIVHGTRVTPSLIERMLKGTQDLSQSWFSCDVRAVVQAREHFLQGSIDEVHTEKGRGYESSRNEQARALRENTTSERCPLRNSNQAEQYGNCTHALAVWVYNSIAPNSHPLTITAGPLVLHRAVSIDIGEQDLRKVLATSVVWQRQADTTVVAQLAEEPEVSDTLIEGRTVERWIIRVAFNRCRELLGKTCKWAIYIVSHHSTKPKALGMLNNWWTRIRTIVLNLPSSLKTVCLKLLGINERSN